VWLEAKLLAAARKTAWRSPGSGLEVPEEKGHSVGFVVLGLGRPYLAVRCHYRACYDRRWRYEVELWSELDPVRPVRIRLPLAA